MGTEGSNADIYLILFEAWGTMLVRRDQCLLWEWVPIQPSLISIVNLLICKPLHFHNLQQLVVIGCNGLTKCAHYFTSYTQWMNTMPLFKLFEPAITGANNR